MWVKMPAEFGKVVKDLSPNETDQSKKSLWVIEYDDKQRDFSAEPQYYGLFWSSDGPDSVNKIAISLWDRFPQYPFPGDEFKDHRDCEHNIDGEKTADGECYSGFACFGYGNTAISLTVAQLEAEHDKKLKSIYNSGSLLMDVLALNNVPTKEVKGLMAQLRKPPWERDEDCMRRIHALIGGPEPKDLPRTKPAGW